MYIDAPAEPVLSTQKVAVLRRLQSLVHLSWFIARCTKGISSRERTEIHSRRRELIHGTNFRHAVEFSRSGRAPSRPFRAGRGQPELHYPVGFARSNTTGTARIPLGRGDSKSLAPRAWGTSARFHPALHLAVRPVSWLRLADVPNTSQRPNRGANRPPPEVSRLPQTTRAARRLPLASTRPASSARARS
jgi:hypothetical protein